jgi:hypothetical protein
MILTESARRADRKVKEGDSRTLQEAQRLIEQAISPLRDRVVKSDAREEAIRILEAMSLPDASKRRIIERSVSQAPTDGQELDVEKFRETVVKEAQDEGRYLAELTGSGAVFGMGMPQEPAIDPKRAEQFKEAAKLREAENLAVFAELMGNPTAAKFAAQGRAN